MKLKPDKTPTRPDVDLIYLLLTFIVLNQAVNFALQVNISSNDL